MAETTDTPVREALAGIRQREVQALHAAFSNRSWHDAEVAGNALRDKIDALLRALSSQSLPPDADEVERLREALEPFARVAEHDIGEDEADSDRFRPASAHNRAPLLTVGDMRRAHAAIAALSTAQADAASPPLVDERRDERDAAEAWLRQQSTYSTMDELADALKRGDHLAALSTQVQTAAPRPADDPDEAYEIGKRDGYEEAVQDIDLMTGGDGEHRYCTNHDPERHCPDAETMKARIVERFNAAPRPADEALQSLADQAQELGMGYAPADDERAKIIEECAKVLDDWLARFEHFSVRAQRDSGLVPTEVVEELRDEIRALATEGERR